MNAGKWHRTSANLTYLACTYSSPEPYAMYTALATLSPPAHRMDIIGESSDGVLYVNDSKATNVESVLVALSGIGRRSVVLLGGIAKRLKAETASQRPGEAYFGFERLVPLLQVAVLFSLSLFSCFFFLLLLLLLGASAMSTPSDDDAIPHFCHQPSTFAVSPPHRRGVLWIRWSLHLRGAHKRRLLLQPCPVRPWRPEGCG